MTDLTVYKNATFETTFVYVDSNDNPIYLGNTFAKMQIRPLDNNTSTPVVTIDTVVTSPPSEAGNPCFYFPYTAPNPNSNTVILYIPQPDAESVFNTLTPTQKYFYDIIVEKSSGAKVRLVSGRFTILSGVTDV